MMQEELERERRKQDIRKRSYENGEFLKEKINKKYIDDNVNKASELRKLNKSIKLPGQIFSIFYALIGCVLFSLGISIILKALLSSFLWLGILFLILGFILFLSNYFIYKLIYKRRRKKFRHQIEELLN